jgi:hypothetical protein
VNSEITDSASEKLHLIVFIPLSACACTYSHFMDRFQKIILPHKERIAFDVRDAASKEAEPYEIYQSSVLILNPVNEIDPRLFTSLNDFEKYIKQIFETPPALRAD